MPRNTLFLVVGLAVLAAIVVGANIMGMGRPTPIPPIATITPTPATHAYTSETCGITFQYPTSYTQAQTPENNALFTDTSGNSIVALCQKDIPRVPLPDDKIETITIGDVSANLYHDASQKDGTPVDKLIFTHPKTGLDVYIVGYGIGFSQVVSTLQLLP